MKKRPSRDEVRAEYRLVNELFFGGVLHPELPIHWVASTKFYGDCEGPCERWPYGRVRLSTGEMPQCGWRGILLHELIHLACDMEGFHHELAGRQPPDEYEHGTIEFHGAQFAAHCNRIGAELGLPTVEEEDCWAWPHCHHLDTVEPAGGV